MVLKIGKAFDFNLGFTPLEKAMWAGGLIMRINKSQSIPYVVGPPAPHTLLELIFP